MNRGRIASATRASISVSSRVQSGRLAETQPRKSKQGQGRQQAQEPVACTELFARDAPPRGAQRLGRVAPGRHQRQPRGRYTHKPCGWRRNCSGSLIERQQRAMAAFADVQHVPLRVRRQRILDPRLTGRIQRHEQRRRSEPTSEFQHEPPGRQAIRRIRKLDPRLQATPPNRQPSSR
jgi:hypothetical protein